MARDNWTGIRVRKATAERLRQRIDDMRREYYAGHQSATPVEAGELSVDGLLNWLLDERENHRARARRAKAPRRAGDASDIDTGDGGDSASDRV